MYKEINRICTILFTATPDFSNKTKEEKDEKNTQQQIAFKNEN